MPPHPPFSFRVEFACLQRVWRVAKVTKNDTLFQACINVMAQNFDALVPTDFFGELEAHWLFLLLKSAALKGVTKVTEQHKLAAISAWVEHASANLTFDGLDKLNNRLGQFANLIESVNFSLIAKDFALVFLTGDNAIIRDKQCRYVHIP